MARARKNIALFYDPTRRLSCPLVPCMGFVLIGDRPVSMLPDLINPMQIVTALDLLTLWMVGHLLENFIARTRDQILIGLICRHDAIPFFIKLVSRLNLSPDGNSIIPIQIVASLRVNLRGNRGMKYKGK